MRKQPRHGSRLVAALLACFGAGGIVGWWLHAGPPVPAVMGQVEAPRETWPAATSGPVETSGTVQTPGTVRTPGVQTSGTGRATATTGASEPDAIDALHRRDLRLPIDGARIEAFKGEFEERRDSGGRPHEAVDMLAPRNTPIHAVENGTIAKLFFSKAGGHTIYQYDPGGRFCYYYAHLERYADGVREGAAVSAGDVIGFVGTSGNAPVNTPHLHFAIFELTADRHWWQGKAIDPYLVFRP
jgi:murein DD-endopeptidase MepM/ murein hydrolase activator NlpD